MLNIFSQNLFLGVLNILNFVFLAISFYKPKPVLNLIPVILFAALSVIQIKSVNFREVYRFSASELDLQIQRMNLYPPKLARLGYILERKKETQIIKRIEKNFFDTIDFNSYFPNYFSYFEFPFILYGIYLFIKKKVAIQIGLFTYSFLLITIFGVHGKIGPFILFPFINLFIFIGFVKIFRFDRKT